MKFLNIENLKIDYKTTMRSLPSSAVSNIVDGNPLIPFLKKNCGRWSQAGFRGGFWGVSGKLAKIAINPKICV